MKKNSKKFSFSFIFYFFPPSFWLIFFFLTPLFLLWVYSFGETNSSFGVDLVWSLTNYKRAFEGIYISVLFKSIFLSAITTIVSLVAGFLIALFIAFSSPKLKVFWLMLIILPFWTNLLIRVFGIVSIFSSSGVINSLLELNYDAILVVQEFLNIKIISGEFFVPFEFIYNYSSVVLGMVYVSLPFMVLPIYGSLDRLDISFLEASLDLGANHLQTIWKVMIPMILPGIKTGVFLTFIPSLSSFLIPEMLGGPNAQMIANVIQRQFGSASNWPFGSALAFVLMYITFAAIALQSAFGSKKRRAQHLQ